MGILQKILNENPIILIALIIYILIFLACILGIVGNGTVIWLLGFRMKRNPFTTYILNLAIADIGVLIVTILIYIYGVYIIIRMIHYPEIVSFSGLLVLGSIWSLLYITDQLILTVISIDRCVAVLFPVWHRCHRRPGLSKAVCVFIWVLSFLITGLDLLLVFVNQFSLLQFTVNVAICTPLMAISTITLSVKICMKSQQRKRGKLLVTILLALFFFLLFGCPMNYMYILMYCYILDGIDTSSVYTGASSSIISNMTFPLSSWLDQLLIVSAVAFACTVLNCSVNPLIYFLVGRDKKSRTRSSMKAALQRVFKEEENCSQAQAETQL